MTIPTRSEAAQILRALGPPEWLLTHSTGVGEVAAFLADRVRQRGYDLPAELPESAAILHDVDKTPPLKARRQELGHGFAGAAWLAEQGFAELGPAVASHPATRLSDEHGFAAWLARANLTEKIVAYADKRFTLDLVPMADRFAEWEARHPDRANVISSGRVLAAQLEQEVCAAAGLLPEEVGRS